MTVLVHKASKNLLPLIESATGHHPDLDKYNSHLWVKVNFNIVFPLTSVKFILDSSFAVHRLKLYFINL
jgi:hypothetical protein